METVSSTTRVQEHSGTWNREFSGTVTHTEPVMGDSMLITFSAPPALVPGVRAGQFVEILCRSESSWDPLLRRPYSIYDVDPHASTFTVLVRPYGRGSAWLCDRSPGSMLSVLGPLGNAFTIAEKSRNLLMVAGGVGAAPLLMLAKDATRRGLSVTYLLGGMTADALLDARFVPGEVEYVVATDDGSQGHHGFVTDLVPGYLQWADQVFSCGPEAMFRSLRQVVLATRFGQHPPVQVSVERTMACGVGACLGCVVETRHGMKPSCVDGPVFDMDQVIWS
ncbi:MAG TPA: dihydroorotate dehydrogenase electron transfer subunit [Thermomicrobiales bacterium]|nr:dihydroorotate dehydrogenase electron transfer subunit [Thermomicrobiales bacterium]